MRVALVRHPRPLIEPGVCYGRLDVKLHPEGLAELPRMVGELSAFAAAEVWTSPAQRCAAVAEALSGAAMRDARLLELDFGMWEGAAWDLVDRSALDLWAASPLRFAPPGGESGEALIGRVRTFHAMLLDAARDCVVVSHGGPLKVLLALLRGAPVDLLAAPMAWGEVAVLNVRAG